MIILVRFASVLAAVLLGGCFTDAATRLAYDIETGAGRVGQADGASYTLVHRPPSKTNECVGPYKVQLDIVGLIVIWCNDANRERTVSSHSTSYHRRFVDTPKTYIVDKAAGEALVIELERHGSRVLISSVR